MEMLTQPPELLQCLLITDVASADHVLDLVGRLRLMNMIYKLLLDLIGDSRLAEGDVEVATDENQLKYK
jgi:hypothetical protein